MERKTTARARVKGIFALCSLIFGLVLPPSAAAQDDARWRFDPYGRVEVGFVSAESGDREEQIVVDGDAVTLRLQAGIELDSDTTTFQLEADRIYVDRLGEGRSSYQRDRFTATLDQELDSDWEIRLQARRYDDFITAEANDTDETSGLVRFTYEPERAHRFRLSASWREREYDPSPEDGPDAFATTGRGPRVDAEYRHRLGRYHYIAADLRAESIASDEAFRRYSRQSAAVSYTRPLNRDLRVRPGVEAIHTRFGGRTGDDGEVRSDFRIAPEVELLWWPGQWRIEAEAKAIFIDSNDERRDRAGYRLTIAAGYVF